jgi:hypothetical protein
MTGDEGAGEDDEGMKAEKHEAGVPDSDPTTSTPRATSPTSSKRTYRTSILTPTPTPRTSGRSSTPPSRESSDRSTPA